MLARSKLHSIESKMSEEYLLQRYGSKMSGTTYYQRNKKVILNRANEYYQNNREVLKEKARNKYRELSEKEKK